MKSAFALLGLLPVALAQQATVYMIRHGEKPSDGGDGLSSQGEQRAQCVASVFGSSSNYNIGYIMAETPKSDGSRARPYDTVEPLAQELDLTVDTGCSRDDSQCVANVVDNYSGSGNILICWEHGELTDIAAALGVSNPPEYPDSDYGEIWTVPYDYTQIVSITDEDCSGLGQ